MVAYYQSKFFHGYALNRAWQEIPISSVIEILDTVRTRVLKLMLELQQEVGDVDNLIANHKVDDVAPTVQNIFNTTVYGGTAIVASDTAEIDARTQTLVVAGDFESLEDALRGRGIDNDEVEKLRAALNQDSNSSNIEAKPNVKKWIVDAAKKVASATGNAAVDVAKASLTAMITAYLGLPPS